VQANPFNQDLEKKYKAFIEQRAQQISACRGKQQKQEEDGGGLATSGESSMMYHVRRITVGTLKGVTNIGSGKGLSLNSNDSSAGSDVVISAPLSSTPRQRDQHPPDADDDAPKPLARPSSVSQLSLSGGALAARQVSPRSELNDVSSVSPKRRSLSYSANSLLNGLRLSTTSASHHGTTSSTSPEKKETKKKLKTKTKLKQKT
jgi:hypothetical protein